MTKLYAVLVLALVIVQSFLLPAAVKADIVECPVVSITLLPATNITETSATLSGTICITDPRVFGQSLNQGQGGEVGLAVFEYGTTPGSYTNNYGIASGPNTSNAVVLRQSAQLHESSTFCEDFSINVSNLTPCTTYYYRIQFQVLLADTSFSGMRGAGIGLDCGRLQPGVLFVPLDCPMYYYSNEMSFQTPGCTIGSGSHQSGGIASITITPPTNPSNIVVQSATITSARVSPGQAVDVTASVTNKGGSNGTSKVVLYINGQEADSKGVALTSGQSTVMHFSISQNDPGTYTVMVNGTPAGSFTVDLFTNNDALIYGVIALFTVGIIGVLYLVVRRRTV